MGECDLQDSPWWISLAYVISLVISIARSHYFPKTVEVWDSRNYSVPTAKFGYQKQKGGIETLAKVGAEIYYRYSHQTRMYISCRFDVIIAITYYFW